MLADGVTRYGGTATSRGPMPTSRAARAAAAATMPTLPPTSVLGGGSAGLAAISTGYRRSMVLNLMFVTPIGTLAAQLFQDANRRSPIGGQHPPLR